MRNVQTTSTAGSTPSPLFDFGSSSILKSKKDTSLPLTCTSYRSECTSFMDAYQDSMGIHIYIYIDLIVIPSSPRLSRSLQNRQAYCSRHGYGLVMALGLAPLENGTCWEYDGNGGVRKLGQVTEEQRMEIKSTTRIPELMQIIWLLFVRDEKLYEVSTIIYTDYTWSMMKSQVHLKCSRKWAGQC